MQYTFKLLTPILMIVFLASCNKKPSAGFGFSTTVPLIDEEITFNNSSVDAESYSWDFGDGTSSEAISPKKAYAVEGTYNVTLTAYASNGKKWNKKSQIITVVHPQALFTGQIDGVETRLMHGVNGSVYGYGHTQTLGSGTKSRVYEAKIGRYSGPSTLQEIKLEIGTQTYSDALTLAQTHPFFHSAILVQDYFYSNAAAAGVRISYVDTDGITWSTDAGTGNQSTSTFIITYTQDRTDAGFEAEFMKAHFKCNLYNGLGGMKVVTNGILELIFANKP
jgi:PKD repeat protein